MNKNIPSNNGRNANPGANQPAKSVLESSRPSKAHFAGRVLVKGTLFFMIANLIFALINPMSTIGRISAYNFLFPGRLRLPYADYPDRAYSISLDNLEAMYASHELTAGKKPPDEFRVILIGDSSIWGFLLPPELTLSAQMNEKAVMLPDQRRIRFYNIGYPVMSLTKDLLLMSRTLAYEPDMIIWLITLESFPKEKQLYPPLLQNNVTAIQQLNDDLILDLNLVESALKPPGFWERTIVGSRRELADIFRLQFYGPLWAATGIDQDIPETFSPPQENFDTDLSFHSLMPPQLHESDLAMNVLEAGIRMVEPTPIIIINEPIFISQGKNSNLRYNFYYPRWAYDEFRKILAEKTAENFWRYRDFWNIIPAEEFTNSAVHLSSAGNHLLADQVMNTVLEEFETQSQP